MTRIGSMCTGYSGLDTAVRAVLGGTVAWHADNDPYAAKLLAHHWPTIPNLGDLTAVDWTGVEPVDIVTAVPGISRNGQLRLLGNGVVPQQAVAAPQITHRRNRRMTTVKLDSKLGGGPAAAIEPHIPALYGRPGCRVLIVAELAHTERTQPAPDSDGEPSVKMRISSMEIAAKEQEGALREALRALHLQRTAYGTLDEHGQIVLTETTLKHTGGLLSEIELARLRAGLLHWAQYARGARATPNPVTSEILHELQTIADGLTAVLSRAAVEEDD